MIPAFKGPESIEFIIADRSTDDLDLAVMCLGMIGCDETKVTTVRSAEETIKKVKELQSGDPKEPLVVMLNGQLSSPVSGLACAEILNRMDRPKRRPMLVWCSNETLSNFTLQPYSANFAHFIKKPFSPSAAQELLEEVENAINPMP